MRRQFSLLLGERARMSREMHDTLLQSLVGVALQFDAIASDAQFASGSAREQLVRMRKQVEEHIREARQSIWDLRSPKARAGRPGDGAARSRASRRPSDQPGVFEFSAAGDPFRCSRKVEEQLLRIGQEAVLNAVRHATAGHIRMKLEYDADAAHPGGRDDGRGFEHAPIGEISDHYGLISMRERAEDVGGQLEIISRPNSGTQVKATVPASSQAVSTT